MRWSELLPKNDDEVSVATKYDLMRAIADDYYDWYEDEQDALISAVLLLDDVLEMFVGRIEGMAEGVGGPK